MNNIRNYIKEKVILSGAIDEDGIAFSNALSTDWKGESYVSIDFDEATTKRPIINGFESGVINDFKIVVISTNSQECEQIGKQIGVYIIEQVNNEADDDESLISGLIETDVMVEQIDNESPGQETALALYSYTQYFKIYHNMR